MTLSHTVCGKTLTLTQVKRERFKKIKILVEEGDIVEAHTTILEGIYVITNVISIGPSGSICNIRPATKKEKIKFRILKFFKHHLLKLSKKEKKKDLCNLPNFTPTDLTPMNVNRQKQYGR